MKEFKIFEFNKTFLTIFHSNLNDMITSNLKGMKTSFPLKNGL